MKQGQYQPLPIEVQVAVLFAGVRGYLDPIALERITDYEEKLRAELQAKGQDILEAIRSEKEISEATEDKLKSLLANFSKGFA